MQAKIVLSGPPHKNEKITFVPSVPTNLSDDSLFEYTHIDDFFAERESRLKKTETIFFASPMMGGIGRLKKTK